MTVEVPREHARSLRELLARHGLQHTERGWFFKTFTISGSAVQLATFEPVLRAWEFDCASGDAW